jgi:Skp family chaperone for outer membrane proteins
MTIFSRAALAALVTSIALPAAAQQAAAPAGATPTNPGPVIPGVCVLNEQGAILGSAAGRAYATRIQQLGQAVNAELTPQRTAIETEARAIQALPENQRGPRTQALQPRVTQYQQLANTRQQELAATERRQLGRIAEALQPVVAQVYVQRSCGMLIDQQSVVYANPAMNITEAVVTALNARLPSLGNFERERAPAPGAAAPAATAPATRR